MFFFIILSMVCSKTLNVHKRLLMPRLSSKLFLCGGYGGGGGGRVRSIMLLGPVIKRKKGEWNWRQFSISGIMSLEAGWCQSSWYHWGWLWFDPRSPPVVFAPAVPADKTSIGSFKHKNNLFLSLLRSQFQFDLLTKISANINICSQQLNTLVFFTLDPVFHVLCLSD